MRIYDVFNGDAGGICALIYLGGADNDLVNAAGTRQLLDKVRQWRVDPTQKQEF